MRWIIAVAVIGTLLTSPAPAAEETDVVEASLVAPDQVDARHPIRVEWKGPRGRGDAIHLFDPAGNDGGGKRLAELRLRAWGKPDAVVVFPAPVKPGIYELRYWDGTKKTVLASRPVKVVPGTIEITAPESVEGAGTITIDWVGPGGEYDMLRLHDANAPYGNHGEKQIVREKRLRTGDFEGKRVRLIAPAKPGKYELHYVDGQNHNAILATRPIEVKATKVSLDAPATVVAGEAFTVQWVGPDATADEIQIIDAQGKRLAGGEVSKGNRDEKTVDLTAPKAAGAYELRYWSGANFRGLATRPIEVVAP